MSANNKDKQTMARKLYPLGIQTFERIRKEDKLYVDKTEYIYRMTHTNGTYFFLGRPRRFGKSLLVSTLQSYFEGKKDFFKGLAIEKLEKEWTEYPVLHFDMSGGKHMEKDQLERYLGYILEIEENKWGITTNLRDSNTRLMNLINTAYEKSGKQVVVLIDEYDAPMLDVAHEKEQLDVLRNIMRNFYSPLKFSEPKLRFVFLTGITNYEGHYQQMLFIIFTLLTDYLVDVEVHTPNGRVDIVILTKTDLYLLELKFNKDAQTAMQQINLQDYRKRFALSDKPITKVGINFDSTTRNITDWVIE